MTRRIVILGSTGSIGTQALDIVRANPDQFEVIGLAAGGGNMDLLVEQICEFNVSAVAVADGSHEGELRIALLKNAQANGVSADAYTYPNIYVGDDASSKLAAIECDVVLNGITGAVGLAPTLAALQAGNTLALANKESLVVGGKLVTSQAKSGQIVPVDSEHSALAQCLRSGSASEVRRLILTASGGPFRGQTKSELEDISIEEALAHPTWAMGPVVTINSATLMNKGLEVIEAHLLFGIPMDAIDVVVHPQSIVHSMVEFVDGSTIAQASPPSMHLPIALGINWPDRVPDAVAPCDWTQASQWTFEPVDNVTFPALELAKMVGTRAGTAPAVMNAANEVAVDAFLNRQIAFLEIVDLVEAVVEEHLTDGHITDDLLTLEHVLVAIDWAKERTRVLIEQTAYSV